MKQTMSIATRKELAATLTTRYASANRREKKLILDELTATVHYHRKHAIRLFNKQWQNLNKPHAPRRKRPPKYNAEVKDALIAIWKATNYLCSKRLVACLPEFITAMERHGHLSISPETRTKLLSISTATIDRLLYDIRHGRKKRSLCTTSPGALLKHQIPIRTFSDWNDLKPGYMEADLVAHCGTSVQGTFLNTLVLTDIATGWTECLALLLRSGAHVMIALKQVRPILPFPLLGLDTDNGSEFLNNELFKYCQNERINFTRCRPYRKNDQCHVEQKNGAIVRRIVGYDRYEGTAGCKELATLYGVLRLYINFFQPSMKLLSKHRNGSKIIKKYDKPQTPFQRLLSCAEIPDEIKAALQIEFAKLDPIELQKQIEHHQNLLWQYAYRPPMLDNNHQLGITGTAMGNYSTNVASQRDHSNAQPREISRFYHSTKKPRKKSSIPHHWRTHPDRFALVWPQIEEQLEEHPNLEAKSIFQALQRRYPGVFKDGQLRTLQRRVRQWRLDRAVFCDGVIMPVQKETLDGAIAPTNI